MFKKKVIVITLFALFVYVPVFLSESDATNIVNSYDENLYKEVFTQGVNLTEVHTLLQNYKGTFSEKAIIKILEDSKLYRAYVRKQIKEHNLPFCLEYLPIIESDYKPTAKPANGFSMGIWQFMPNSVSPYMELSEYVDERRDPWISTDGALKKLYSNYKTFNDWLLALAAYNCGAGAVTRALQKATDKSFSGLCKEDLIPDHAKNYVKKFLALCNLIINAKPEGKTELLNADTIEEIEYIFYNDYDYVITKKIIKLETLALETRLELEILQKLNLSLIKGVTPPNREYKLRIPYGMKDIFNAVLKNVEN